MHSRRTICRSAQVFTACGALLLASVSAAQGAGGDGRVLPPGGAAEPVAEAPLPVVQLPIEATKPTPSDQPEAEGGPDEAGPIVAELAPTSTEEFGLVGVTWASGSGQGVEVEIRTRHDGVWTEWQHLEVEAGDGDGLPGERDGTEAAWVGQADGVAVRLKSESGAPTAVRLATVDTPDEDDASTASPAFASRTSTTATSVADGSPTYTAQPAVIRRSSWGAGSPDYCSSPQVGSTTRGVVVHHTAGSNTYSESQSAGIVRGIQAYHMNGRGWCDIGYNFLVDKYGQIFEGRSGGIRKNVRAAHSGNDAVNTYTTGISMMGNLDTARPTAAMRESVVKLAGWRIGTTFLPATGSYSLGGKTLQMIAGHRNVVSTGCPGKYGYQWLTRSGGLRDRVAAYVANYSSDIKTRAEQLGKSITGDVYVGEFEVDDGRRARFSKVDIFDTSGRSAREVGGAFRTTYTSKNAQDGPLGFPTSSARSSSSAGVRVQKFEHGRIFEVSSSKAYGLWDGASDLYLDLGGPAGMLGHPTSNQRAESSGIQRINFDHGFIRLNTSTGEAEAYDDSNQVISSSAPTSDELVVDGSTIRLRGRGYGHGIGMSQHGAREAAESGVSLTSIMQLYYPGTKSADTSGSIRVLLTQATSRALIVKGRSYLFFRDLATNTRISLPRKISGETVTRWRFRYKKANPSVSILRYKVAGSSWLRYGDSEYSGDAQFERGAPYKVVALQVPGGDLKKYRGALRFVDRKTVNVVPLDSYVRGVVPREMPPSWHPVALRAQSVAARTYGVANLRPASNYDLCDTTACQVYGGVSAEDSRTDLAASMTSNRIRTYQGEPAFTQFSASSGGWTAQGSKPYLKATEDPYDNYPVWQIDVSVSSIESRYGLGNLERVKVLERTGDGAWGGRVESIKFYGSSSDKTITGNEARSVLGLKSTWFKFD